MITQLRVAIFINFAIEKDEIYIALENMLKKLNPQCDLEIILFNRVYLDAKVEVYLNSMVDELIDFIGINAFDKNVSDDFYDLYLSYGSNDILIDLKDLKFLDDDFYAGSTDMVSKNNTQNCLVDTMRELIIEDKNEHLINADMIFVLFKVNRDTPIMKVNDSIELLRTKNINSDILFNVKFDNKDATKDEKIILLSVKESQNKDLAINFEYSKEVLEIIKTGKELSSRGAAFIEKERKIRELKDKLMHEF